MADIKKTIKDLVDKMKRVNEAARETGKKIKQGGK